MSGKYRVGALSCVFVLIAVVVVMLATCKTDNGQDLTAIEVTIKGIVEGTSAFYVKPGWKTIEANGSVGASVFYIDLTVTDDATGEVEAAEQFSGDATALNLNDGDTAYYILNFELLPNQSSQIYLHLLWSAPPLSGIDVIIEHDHRPEFRSISIVPGAIVEEGEDLSLTIDFWNVNRSSPGDTISFIASLSNDVDTIPSVNPTYIEDSVVGSDTIEVYNAMFSLGTLSGGRLLLLTIDATDISNFPALPFGRAAALFPAGSTYQYNDSSYLLSAMLVDAGATTQVYVTLQDDVAIGISGAEVLVWERGNPINYARGVTDSGGQFNPLLNNKANGGTLDQVVVGAVFLDIFSIWQLIDIIHTQ